jgi:hypothetical protein
MMKYFKSDEIFQTQIISANIHGGRAFAIKIVDNA